MPSQITHIVYGQRLLELRSELGVGGLLRGSIFPDIRSYAQLDREATHWPGKVGWKQVWDEPNSWRAGVLFHNWIDDRWNDFFGKYGLDIEDERPESVAMWAALKVLEDRLVRVKVVNPDGVCAVLPQPDMGVKDYGIELQVAVEWGELVAAEIGRGWGRDEWKAYATQALRRTPEFVEAVLLRLDELEKEGVWEERLEECWQQLNYLMVHGDQGGR